MTLNPYAYIGAAVVMLALFAGGYAVGHKDVPSLRKEVSRITKERDAKAEAYRLANDGLSNAIAALRRIAALEQQEAAKADRAMAQAERQEAGAYKSRAALEAEVARLSRMVASEPEGCTLTGEPLR